MPADLSSTYSHVLARAAGGKLGCVSMRLMTAPERPVVLWFARRIVHGVLRERPSTSACSSRLRLPRATSAAAICLILMMWSSLALMTHPRPAANAPFLAGTHLATCEVRHTAGRFVR